MFALHMRDHRSREKDNTHEVCIDRFPPLFEAGRHESFRRWSAGIRDANVDTAEFFRHGIDERVYCAGMRDVKSRCVHIHAGLFANLLRSSIEGVLITSAHRNPAALGRKCFSRGPPNALAGSGYDDNPLV
jgi:hypothetical protein